MSQIKPLPTEVINLIAAGEVIDSLAAVARELIENAIDANCDRIIVNLWSDLWQIQIADNGKGMSLADLQVCVNPHSTSKITCKADIWQLKTLGFRGEALHSIAQVADLEIWSRESNSDKALGWQVVYNSGQVMRERAVAIAAGTVVKVTNLFAKLPVRRKALPSVSQQLKAIQQLIEQVAIANPQITWQVWKDDKPWFNISASTAVPAILTQLLKRVHYTDFKFLSLPVSSQDLGEEDKEIREKISSIPLKLELSVGLPDRVHRYRPDWLKVAVNGRVVKSLQLEQAILQAYSKTLPRDRYPICFAHLWLPPHQVDWNRHPAKTEVFLHNIDFWQKQIRQGIEQALCMSEISLGATVENQRVKKVLKVAENKANYQAKSSKLTVNQNKCQKNLSLIDLKAVAQVRNTYIVAEHSSGIWLIEQHIAHERILYEQLEDNWQLIPLESPIILSKITDKQQKQLRNLQLTIESFGDNMWAVRSIPQMLASREDITDALLELSQGGDLKEAMVAVACRSAIRNGMSLNFAQMQSILDDWKITRNPRTCPHGRPIYLSLEESALARFFRRHWVIGKSHGI
ncbi:MAG: DNA mismatch repair endonuclease MutL [Cyanobacteria bacterium J083]|nr:MAG: DNA mismatch repair endonuclease MutL [Cyanobacteria bacterium J083]